MGTTIIASAYGLWLAFLASWWLAAAWTAKAKSYGVAAQNVRYLLGFALGFGLLFTARSTLGGRHLAFGLGACFPAAWQQPLWQNRDWASAGLVLAEFAAFAFAWWARLHLGKLWSAMMTLREGHRVIESGPYAIVRHPIYTGFIGASWALALITAAPLPLIGAVVLTIVMAVKARAEERLLSREMGPAIYRAYQGRVPMLMPFGPR